MPVTPYAAGGIPITSGMPAMAPNDNLGTTPEGRARAEAFRRLMAKAPNMDYQSALQQLPGQMMEERGAMAAAGPTVLQPSRTTAFNRSDAQSLQGLDPRALEEARGLAAMPEAQSKPMTGTFNGQSFTMQPSARVDRNALAGIYQKYLSKQAQERQDSVRAQEQGGRERIVGIPGEQATQRRKMELETEERLTGKKIEADAPVRAADIAAKGAQTAAVTGAETRAAAAESRLPSPEQESADALYERLTTGPFAQTAQARAAAAQIFPKTSYARGVPAGAVPGAAEAAGAQPGDVGTAIASIAADPAIAALVERAKGTKPGFFTGGEGRATNTAARKVARAAIMAKARQAGVPESEIQDYIVSVLGPDQQTTSMAVPGSAALRALPLGIGNLPANMMGAMGR
jgi:hypothetical protein